MPQLLSEALVYTPGSLLVSADDDMRPYVLMEHSPESLEPEEICRGRLHRAPRRLASEPGQGLDRAAVRACR